MARAVTVDKHEIIDEIAKTLEEKGFENIKADHPDFETPTKFVRQDSDGELVPHITAHRNGSKYYIEVSQKTEKVSPLVSKWKLLHTIASLKNARFQLFVPYGSMQFTKKLVEKHQIDASIYSL